MAAATHAQPPVAAIDAGSNGIRLVIANLDDDGTCQCLHSSRAAVRLGADAFSTRRFSAETISQAVQAFREFRTMLDEHEVTRISAVATSAAREADNAGQLVEAVREASGIQIEIIDGLEEAQLIFDAVASSTDLAGRRGLLIDMGGGSVELTVARNGRAMASETLRLGPVRLMQQLLQRHLDESHVGELIDRYRDAVASLIHAEFDDDEQPDLCIGTGGNIECLGKLRPQMLGKKKTGKVKRRELDTIIEQLLAMTPQERVDQLGMRPDRADVIAIAAIVLRMVLRSAGVRKLQTPGIGLKDGLLHRLLRAPGS